MNKTLKLKLLIVKYITLIAKIIPSWLKIYLIYYY